jgi:hypothetical protein
MQQVIIKAALVAMGAIVAGIVVAKIISYKDIINWFKKRKSLLNSDCYNLAVTIRKELENGNYEVVGGVFNCKTETFKDQFVKTGKQLDSELASLHSNREVVYHKIS